MTATTLGPDSQTADGTDGPVPGQARADSRIAQLRDRIDAIDAELISLWRERAAISQEVGATRVAAGGTRLVLSREQEILARFRQALGADGVNLAMLVLRAGRGPLLPHGGQARPGPQPAR
jgi:chorismate mutase